MSLQDGLTPRMKPVSPRRSAIVAALDIGTSKIVCLIARLKPQSPQEVLRRRSHGIEILGIGHTESHGMKGGAVINLAEVEEALRSHPDVAEVAVIAVPDQVWGESVKACVQMRPGKSSSEADLIEYTRTKIASYKKPKSVDFVDSLPRLFNGKIDKKALRAPFWQGRDRQVS